MPNLPPISRKPKICIICEGYEDEAYIKRLISLHVWNNIYDFFTVNAKSASNIPARYQDVYQNNGYELVLVFCDTDKKPYEQYCLTKRKINDFFGKIKAAEKTIIFANPCTMQIILSHFADVSLKNQGKKTNSEIIEKLTGVKGYDAHEDQINDICNKIFQRTYRDMRDRVEKINRADNTSGSTNFIQFLERFESPDVKWIDSINKYLSGK